MNLWIQVRKDLYRQLIHLVRLYEGKESKELSLYKKEYENEFHKKWKISHLEAFLDELKNKEILYLADFHSMKQSQKAELRFLKKVFEQQPFVLAVEFFEIRHQKIIDAYLNGKMSEKIFLKKTQWKKNWGFPWENYKIIVDWARQNGLPIYGLNVKTSFSSARSLKKRDQMAAKRIQEIHQLHPKTLKVVIYGDLHLAKKHLPYEVQKKDPRKYVIVHQNSEKIYFSLLKKNLDVDLIKFNKYQFCLMSVTPWVKWQNYLIWLEKNYDIDLDQKNEELDYTEHVEKYYEVLGQDLFGKKLQGHFSVYTAKDEIFWDKLTKAVNSKEVVWYRKLIEDSQSFYLPDVKIAFLGLISVNHAAGLAMMILHAEIAKRGNIIPLVPQNILAMIWLEAIQYFGSKLINPKRKTDMIKDIKKALEVQNVKDQGRETLQICLYHKMQEILFLSGLARTIKTHKAKNPLSYQGATRLLGGILGERIFFAYHRGILKKSTLLKWLKVSPQDPDFEEFYFRILVQVQKWPEPFISKTEKL